MDRLALRLACFLTTLAWVGPAWGCWASHSRESQVVGVSPKGFVLVFSTISSENGDGPSEAFSLYDARGHPVERLVLSSGATPDGPHVWISEDLMDREPRLAVPPALREADASRVMASLRRSLELTLLVPSRIPIRHNPLTDTRCGSIEMKTREGWAPVLEVGELDSHFERCAPVVAQAFEHPASGFLFVRTRWELKGHETEFAIDDDVQWFPRRRLDGLAHALAGWKALAAGLPGRAAEELATALILEPAYSPGYLDAAKAFVGAEADPNELAHLFVRPLPGGQVVAQSHAGSLYDFLERDAPARFALAGPWVELDIGVMNAGAVSLLHEHWRPIDHAWPPGPPPPPPRAPPPPPPVVVEKPILVLLPRLTKLAAPRARRGDEPQWMVLVAFALGATTALFGSDHGSRRRPPTVERPRSPYRD